MLLRLQALYITLYWLKVVTNVLFLYLYVVMYMLYFSITCVFGKT